MWLRLNRYDIMTGELTEVTSLSPAPLGIMVSTDVIAAEITRDLNAKIVELVVIAAIHPHFTHRPVPDNTIACFGTATVDGEKSDHDWAYVVTYD